MVVVRAISRSHNEYVYTFQPTVRICGLCQGDDVTVELNGAPIAQEHADGHCVSLTIPEYEELTFYDFYWSCLKAKYGVNPFRIISEDPCKRSPVIIGNLTTVMFTIAREGYWAAHMAHVCVPGRCVPPILGGQDGFVVFPSFAPVFKTKRVVIYRGEKCENVYTYSCENTYDKIIAWKFPDGKTPMLYYVHIPRATPAYVCVHRGSKKWCFGTPVWNGKVTVYY